MQDVINFILAHQLVIVALVVGLLDFAFAVSPGLESNGILHALYLWLKSLGNKTEPPKAA